MTLFTIHPVLDDIDLTGRMVLLKSEYHPAATSFQLLRIALGGNGCRCFDVGNNVILGSISAPWNMTQLFDHVPRSMIAGFLTEDDAEKMRMWVLLKNDNTAI